MRFKNIKMTMMITNAVSQKTLLLLDVKQSLADGFLDSQKD